MKKFIINEHLSLRLEEKKTHIYVSGEKFRQCMFLLLEIPIKEISSLNEITSIDEASELLDRSEESDEASELLLDEVYSVGSKFFRRYNSEEEQDENIFDIVNHLNQGTEIIQNQEEKDKLETLHRRISDIMVHL